SDFFFGGVPQGSFRDSYRNMTYKHVMALKWAAYRCPGARYLLKTDDDVFVNSPELLRFLARELSPWGARRLILCVPFPYGYVKRSWRSKWRVSPKEYPGRLYPRYCAGWAVLYSPDAVFLLYREAQRVPYFWIDDVHVTGTLAARVNLSQTPLGSLALTQLQMQALVDAAPGADPPPYAAHFLFGSPDMLKNDLYKLWDYVQRGRS
ncbi:Beta-1,3-galactosyltransferase brn, partial [Gryllus bimaculatus]